MSERQPLEYVYHVSEDAGIERFEPRPPATATALIDGPVVWAVDLAHLPNYLLPRDCPRVAFHVAPGSSEADCNRLLGAGGARHAVAIESSWFEHAVASRVCVYAFSPASFREIDATAGYFVSSLGVAPVSRRVVVNPLAELVAMGVELRVVPELHDLASQVASSSLAFSCIRMRNAGLGPAGLQAGGGVFGLLRQASDP